MQTPSVGKDAGPLSGDKDERTPPLGGFLKSGQKRVTGALSKLNAGLGLHAGVPEKAGPASKRGTV